MISVRYVLQPVKQNLVYAYRALVSVVPYVYPLWNYSLLKGNSHQKLSVASMIYDRATPEKFLVYHSPMFEAWKVPKRPVEVSCDVTQHLVAYWTAVGTRTNSSGMRTHTGQHSRLSCMHTLNFA